MDNQEAKQLISEYYRYIESVANKYRLPEHHQDLMQVGRIAAVQSYSTFDSTKSNDIKGHICANIKYAISKYVDENLRTIRIPNHILYSTDEEDAAMMVTTVSANTPINDDGDTLEQLLPASDTYIYPEPNKELKTALMSLSEKERLVLELHLDLNDESEPMTLKDIGDQLGVSRERARQLYQKAITKLQVQMGAEVKKNKINTTTWYERTKNKK
jgi:RNA polymerase sigma factor (sigma-70 family)